MECKLITGHVFIKTTKISERITVVTSKSALGHPQVDIFDIEPEKINTFQTLSKNIRPSPSISLTHFRKSIVDFDFLFKVLDAIRCHSFGKLGFFCSSLRCKYTYLMVMIEKIN